MKIPRLWVAIGASLAIGTVTVFAQPAGTPSAGLAMLVQIEGALNLSAPQKAQFDIAAAATRQAFEATRTRHEQATAVVEAEMARSRPDFSALASYQDAQVDAGRAVHDATRAEWLKLYAMLDDAQASVVKAFLQEHMMRIDLIRDNPGPASKGKWG